MEQSRWEIFNQYYEKNSWGDSHSASGPGSNLAATKLLRPRLAAALARLGVRSLVDAPCGDMHWMRHLNYPFDMFIGVDVVSILVERLRQEASPANFHF